MSHLPDSVDAAGLTLRQRRILEVIADMIEKRGYPPSIREVGEAAGLASPSSVAHQMRALEAKGLIRRDPNRPRAMEVRLPPEVPVVEHGAAPAELTDPTDSGDAAPAAVHVPVLGRIAAGGDEVEVLASGSRHAVSVRAPRAARAPEMVRLWTTWGAWTA